jgi:hypothetical protein
VANSPITLRQYYSSFKSLSGILAGIVVASPYISKVLPPSVAAYSFPPLGDGEAMARIAVVIFAFAMTFGVYFWAVGSPKNTGRIIAFAFVTSALSFCVYFGLHLGFVRRVDIPSLGTAVYVSVGYERTAFADSAFHSASDEDLLRARGLEDEQLRLLWTEKSLIIARLLLYMAYCVCILALVVAFSFGVAHDVLGRERILPAKTT